MQRSNRIYGEKCVYSKKTVQSLVLSRVAGRRGNANEQQKQNTPRSRSLSLRIPRTVMTLMMWLKHSRSAEEQPPLPIWVPMACFTETPNKLHRLRNDKRKHASSVESDRSNMAYSIQNAAGRIDQACGITCVVPHFS